MMVTQVHCNSSKSIMTVVQPILNYSKSVSGCRWCTIQLRFQRYQPEQEIIQIASLRGFQTMMVTQVQCKSSKSKMTVVNLILNYSRSVSSADGVEFNCSSSGISQNAE